MGKPAATCQDPLTYSPTHPRRDRRQGRQPFDQRGLRRVRQGEV